MDSSDRIPARAKPDWDAIERDWRTGRYTNQELAEHYSLTRQAISRRAIKYEWQQDLTEPIRQATRAKLNAQLVESTAQQTVDVVQAAADLNSAVILSHRAGLRRIKAIHGALLDQIEHAVTHLPDLPALVAAAREPDDAGRDKANDALRRALDRPALVDDLKKLAEIDERVRRGEREAYAIDDGSGKDASSIEELLRRLGD